MTTLPLPALPPRGIPIPLHRRRSGLYIGLALAIVIVITISLAGSLTGARPAAIRPPAFRTAPPMFYGDPNANGTAAFLGRAPGIKVRFTADAVEYSKPQITVRMRFVGSNRVVPEGAAQRGLLNIATGAEPGRWLHGALLYQKVKYANLYDGIDLIYGGSAGTIKSEYLVAPGADPSQIRFRFENAVRVSVSAGALVVHTSNGTDLQEHTPEVYQEGKHGRETVPASYRVLEDGSVDFQIGVYDVSRSLVIDPEVTFSTLWGGGQSDALTGVAVGADGSTYICGWTDSADVQTAGAFQPTGRGSTDSFLVKLTPSNTIAYATYLGGQGQDRANAIAVDALGNVYVTGWTSSANFPIVNAVQRQLLGWRNAFVTKLSPSGVPILSTYFGGRGTDSSNAIQVDATGAVYIAGQTTSADFPRVNALQPVFGGIEDAFVAKFAATGMAPVFSTYLGGSGSDQALGLATLNGEAYVTGATDSQNFPTANAFRSSNQGGQDAFVAKLNSTGSALVYSTYLGGSSGLPGVPEIGFGIAVTSTGEAVVAGTTGSRDFPLASPLRSAITGSNNDSFVAKLNSAGTQLVFSTYLGGSGFDNVKSVAVDGSGNVYVAGETTSRDLQVVSPVQAANAGLYNAFVASLTPNGSSLRFSSYWGGSSSDSAAAIALSRSQEIVTVGSTTSWNFPLRNPLQTFNGSNYGGFVTRFSAIASGPRLALYRAGHWVLNFNTGQNLWFGLPGDIPVVGDWDGTGRMRGGVFRDGHWFLDMNGNLSWDGLDHEAVFGLYGDFPVVGDWDGTGRLRVGVYHDGHWLLDMNGNFTWDGLDRDAWFGLAGDTPVVGDWDGTGRLRIGVFRNGHWFLDMNANFSWDGADREAGFGLPGDIPVVGDWDGTGRLRIGVYRNGQWFVDMNGNLQWDGEVIDRILSFGSSLDTPVAAKW